MTNGSTSVFTLLSLGAPATKLQWQISQWIYIICDYLDLCVKVSLTYLLIYYVFISTVITIKCSQICPKCKHFCLNIWRQFGLMPASVCVPNLKAALTGSEETTNNIQLRHPSYFSLCAHTNSHTDAHRCVFIIYATSVAEGNACSHSLASRREDTKSSQSITDMPLYVQCSCQPILSEMQNQIQPDFGRWATDI